MLRKRGLRNSGSGFRCPVLLLYTRNIYDEIINVRIVHTHTNHRFVLQVYIHTQGRLRHRGLTPALAPRMPVMTEDV